MLCAWANPRTTIIYPTVHVTSRCMPQLTELPVYINSAPWHGKFYENIIKSTSAEQNLNSWGKKNDEKCWAHLLHSQLVVAYGKSDKYYLQWLLQMRQVDFLHYNTCVSSVKSCVATLSFANIYEWDQSKQYKYNERGAPSHGPNIFKLFCIE